MKILVTGGTGFVGRALIKKLQSSQIDYVEVGRYSKRTYDQKYFKIEDFTNSNLWTKPLHGCDVVIHLAARVHVMTEMAQDPLTEFRKINVEITKIIALQAVNAGVKRFVYVSSIKVNGEKTTEKPFDESDFEIPEDSYGISKYEAELLLHEISKNTGLEIVIIRPPLIYGPGVKGNFLELAKILKKRIPLPLGSINNLRSLLFVENLIDALILCSIHPDAAGKTYLISDGDDISTPDLVKEIAEGLGIKAILLHCPILILYALAKIIGKTEQLSRLSESLQLDNSKLKRELGWAPRFNLREGLKKTFEMYMH